MAPGATELTYDPYDVAIDADPHPVWKRLRDEAPVYHNEKLDFWTLSRYDDVLRGLLDHESFVSSHGIMVEIINDDPRHYAFSNIFEVASNAKPYEKIAVGKNMEYVVEAIRAEGTSAWRTAAHDEFVLVMDG